MSDKTLIKKASGETEPFSEEKLQASLRRTGAGDETIASVVNDVKSWLQDGTTTKKILKTLVVASFQPFQQSCFNI